MVIQPNYGMFSAPTTRALPVERQSPAIETAKSAGTVTISQAARDVLSSSGSSSSPSVEARLAEIKAKGLLARTPEDSEYLVAHDAKFAEIRDKRNNGASLTSSEIDYQQKAIGFVNTMASLNPAEKQMYDDMVATGNSAAAEGLANIAFMRTTLGHTAGGAEGTTYDPVNTEITAANVVKYFMNTIVDNTGKSQTQFQALIQYLENRPSHPASSSGDVQA